MVWASLPNCTVRRLGKFPKILGDSQSHGKKTGQHVTIMVAIYKHPSRRRNVGCMTKPSRSRRPRLSGRRPVTVIITVEPSYPLSLPCHPHRHRFHFHRIGAIAVPLLLLRFRCFHCASVVAVAGAIAVIPLKLLSHRCDYRLAVITEVLSLPSSLSLHRRRVHCCPTDTIDIPPSLGEFCRLRRSVRAGIAFDSSSPLSLPSHCCRGH